MRNKPEFFQIVVAGKGQFPVDMLRHDCAYPVTEEDSSWISNMKTAAGSGSCIGPKYRVVREVNLICRTLHGPTVRRWESFSWKVLSVIAHYPDGTTAEQRVL